MYLLCMGRLLYKLGLTDRCVYGHVCTASCLKCVPLLQLAASFLYFDPLLGCD